MYRTHTCGELTIADVGKTVTLSGWVQKARKLGAMTFIDIRDRYGITQAVADDTTTEEIKERAASLGREFVIQATGTVRERQSKNPKLATGDIELVIDSLNILNTSATPPFTIEENSDGGDDLRMHYRYLDLRRPPLRDAMVLRHKMAFEIRNYMDSRNFLEIETPYMISSTPEGARDFIVPSRLNPGKFYALPQSPQTFKQLLMVAGYDRYFQIVRCFRDEDLRADRQPEFTQVDCEMSFVERDDVLNMFEGLIKHMFDKVLGVKFDMPFPRMSWEDAMSRYGSDKPDIRFGMEFQDITDITRNSGFVVFDSAEYVGAICAKGCATYTRKQLDQLTEFVKRPQIGAKGLVYARVEENGNVKSSADKFLNQEQLQAIAQRSMAEAGDLILILAGERKQTLAALCQLRLEMGNQLGLRDPKKFAPLWVVDFPLLEWDDETQRYYAMHHPFTSPKIDEVALLDTDPGKVHADAYDFVCNGVEVGGGSIRIHDAQLQQKMFKALGFTEEQAEAQFGFLMNAFKFGAPPHGGIAFGLDRWCSLFAGVESIRDFIAFPKNNAGRDVMIDSPSIISEEQLKELNIKLVPQE